MQLPVNGLTLGSLFDGIGGFPLAAQRCGIRTVWASEIEPNCIAITKRHFPDMRHIGSVTELNGGKIPPVDIISFGSPCQDLSVAGAQKGLSGERSGLFREAIRIIYEMRAATNGAYPTFIIWENVPGAFSSSRGEDFRTVLAEIAKAGISMPDSGKWARAGMVRAGGADIAWRQLDSQYWGIPQRRKRIFLVADFRGQRAAEILFKCESLLGYSEQGAEEGPGIAADSRKCAGVSSRDSRAESESLQCLYETAHANEVIRVYKNGVCPTLQARMGTGGNQIPLVLDMEKTTAFGVSPTLTTRNRFLCDVNCCLRKLTPLECERLQGFPDEWTRYGHTGEEIKDSPRYAAIGNSLAVPCAERVFRGILAVIGGEEQSCSLNEWIL